MQAARRMRFPAALAMVVLVLATSVLRAHVHDFDSRQQQNDTRCELCLQFVSAAGPVAQPSAPCAPGASRLVSLTLDVASPQSRLHTPQLPRAPPSFS